ncbi:MAG TPA: hypothetical protein VF267_13630 [Gammaproteobacteria bacterium]
MNESRNRPLAENRESLWWLAAGPSAWFAHFLLSYVTAATWCAKAAERSASLAPVRFAITAYTVLALAGIIAIGWRGYRYHRYGNGTLPHDDDTSADRHRFLGFATMLLCGLSAVATVYVALAAVFIGSCR